MITLHYLRSITITALTLMLTVAPMALAMENNGDQDHDESTHAQVLLCKIKDIKKFWGRNHRLILLGGNLVFSVVAAVLSFDHNDKIYVVKDSWTGDMGALLKNCTCGPVENIRSNVHEAAYDSNLTPAFIVVSAAGKLLDLACHYWVGEILDTHFNFAFIVFDTASLGTGSLSSLRLWQAKDLLTSAMPDFLRNTLTKAANMSYYLAIPAGQIFYELFQTGRDCLRFCRKEPSEQASVKTLAPFSVNEIDQQPNDDESHEVQ
jgi:hypothetical protein